MQKKKRILIIIGCLILGIIILPVLISVSLSLYSLSINKPVSVPKENPLTVSEESKWMNHKDESAGFSISYPPEMYLAETPFEGASATFLISYLKQVEAIGLPPEISPRIQVFKADKPVSELIPELNEERNKEQFPEYTKIDLKGYEAYQTKALDPQVIFTHTVIGTDEKTYLVEMFTIEKENEALKEIYERMLKTFEIL